MSDVRTPLRGGSASGSSGAAYLGFGYSAVGNQPPGTRDQAWREGIIYTEQAKTNPREAFLMFGNISRVRERGQFRDEKPRVYLQPVFVAAGRPQDAGLNRPALKRYHERRSYLVELVDENVRAAKQPADCGVLPQRAHDHPCADAGKQFDALRPFQDAAGPIRDPLQRRRDERSDDLVDRFEVIVKRAIRDVRLLGDVVDGRAIDSFAPKNQFGRDQDSFACPLASALISIRSCGRIALDDLGRHLNSERSQQASRPDAFASRKQGESDSHFGTLTSLSPRVDSIQLWMICHC